MSGAGSWRERFERLGRRVGGWARQGHRLLAAQRQIGRQRRPGAEHLARVLGEARCGFVLSTGRSGTETLTHVFAASANLDVHHTPFPELAYPARWLYEHAGDGDTELFRAAALAARYELVEASVALGRVFVETSPRITFFAPGLATAFRGARFVHLVRHPGAFVRSGIRRGYFGAEDFLHVRPRDLPAEVFDGWSPIAKVGWLWNATQAFVETFKAGQPAGHVLTLRAEELFRDPAASERVLAFLGAAPVARRRLERILAKPANVQTGGDFPPFERWSEAEKRELQAVAPLAANYGYQLD